MFSAEFQGGAPVIKNGRIETYMGFTFVRVNDSLLPTGTDDASGTSRGLIAYAKSGVHLGVWDDVQTDVSPRYDLEGIPYQVYGAVTVGACRTELKKVVRIWCRGG
jgi:hypothetical protein